MENYFDNIHKFTIFQKTFPATNMPLGYGFVHEPANVESMNDLDIPENLGVGYLTGNILDGSIPHPTGITVSNNSRTLHSYPQFDFYLPVFITRTSNLMEYVDISRDDTIFKMQRQEVNPWFVEFSFFDTIQRNKSNFGSDLTVVMLNYIRTVRPDVASLVDVDLRAWFDNTGKFQLPWNKGEADETNLDTLDRLSYINSNIISKAFRYNIDINK